MFFNVLTQVVILLILILAGVVLAKTNVLTEKGVESMTDFVLFLVAPCVIIKSFIREFDKSMLKNLLISFLIAFFAHIGFIVLSLFIARKKEDSIKRVLQFGVIFSNCGFMSLPLQQALIGDKGVFYGSSFVAIFNLFVWSYGIVLMSGDKKYLTPKKMIINPGMIGITVGILIFIFSIPIPKIISEPISYMASVNTPLPMVIIGYHLYHSNLIRGIKEKQCILSMLARLVVFPAVSIAVMCLLGIKGDMLVSSAISCCAPTAAMTTMFSSKFKNDTELSVSLVSLSTILSLFTIPVIVTFAEFLSK